MYIIFSMTNKRYYWIDTVKALAITLVVLFHSHFCYYTILFPVLAMCVPLFFTVNGMLVLNKDRNLMYYLRKVCKIVFLMILWSTIQTCVVMAFNHDSFILKDICHSVITQKMNYCNTFWFLAHLTVLYLIYPFVSAFIFKNQFNIIFVLIISFMLSFKAFGYVFPIEPLPNILRCWHGEALFYAVAGLCIFKYSDSEMTAKIKKWQIIMLIIFLWAGPLLSYSNIEFFTRHLLGDPVFGLYESPFVMLMTVLVVLLIKKVNPKEYNLITILGQNTLGIYCLHPSIIKGLKYYIEIDNVFINNGIVFFLALSISLLLSMLMQKNKYTRFFVNL